jgi:hypothetical protein
MSLIILTKSGLNVPHRPAALAGAFSVPAPIPPKTPVAPVVTVPAKPPPLASIVLERTPKGVSVNGKPFPTLAQARLYALDLLAKVRE